MTPELLGIPRATISQKYKNCHPEYVSLETDKTFTVGDVIQIDPARISRGRFGVVLETDDNGRFIGYAMPYSPHVEWVEAVYCHRIGRAAFWPDGTKVENHA